MLNPTRFKIFILLNFVKSVAINFIYFEVIVFVGYIILLRPPCILATQNINVYFVLLRTVPTNSMGFLPRFMITQGM